MKFLILLLLPACLIAREYPIKEVVKVVDGDTIDVVIDLGFGITIDERLRLYGIDAWEIVGQEKAYGLRAREFLRSRLQAAKNIVIDVLDEERGKYGRVLATVFADGVNLNRLLVERGHAEAAEY